MKIRIVPIFQITKLRLGQINALKVKEFASGGGDTTFSRRPAHAPALEGSSPALTSPRRAAHRITVMNQRSRLPPPPLRREPATASGSFSARTSSWRSRFPAAGDPVPRCSKSNSSVAARKNRSCYFLSLIHISEPTRPHD